MQVRIRLYHKNDLVQVQALNARVKPYRPEDAPRVERVKARARRAEAAGDVRWRPLPPPLPSVQEAQDRYLGLWGAVQTSPPVREQVVGMVGVDRPGQSPEMPANLSFAQEWFSRSDVTELRHLRVAPEARGQGIGTRLIQAVVEWCRSQGYHTLVCNTAAAQMPALGL